jgi:hypothetical protein
MKTKKPSQHTIPSHNKGQIVSPTEILEDLIGCTGYQGPAKALEEMDEGVAKGARRSR